MNIRKHLEEMSNIHANILHFLESEDNETNLQKLRDIFDEINIHDDADKLKLLLHLLLAISKNYHRNASFSCKIEQILHIFKDNITQHFSNSEIYSIFKGSKKILLYLLEENIMIIDESIAKKIIKNERYFVYDYHLFFFPEIKPYMNKPWFPKFSDINADMSNYEIPNNFYERRKEGENDSYICELIRKDLIDDFVIYVTRNSCQLDIEIESSIYETNSYLLNHKHEYTLIEYAAFYGSIQIFNYLRLNGVKLTPSLLMYAIHGKNDDIIGLLEEENQIKMDDECLIEAIKCHHNDIANYIKNKYDCDESFVFLNNEIKSYNFNFIQSDLIDDSLFILWCKYDYFIIVSNIIRKESETVIKQALNIVFIKIFFLIQFNDL